MPRFRNDTGSVLNSEEFGALPPGEFDLNGFDPEVHGVIPGCIPLDEPEPGSAGEDGDGAGDAPAGAGRPPRKRKGADEQDKETAE